MTEADDGRKFELELMDDYRALGMRIHGGGMVLGHSVIAKMTTRYLDSLIAQLGFCRRQMVPEIPRTWPAGTALHGVERDPAYMIEADSLAGDVVLHVRSGDFGWQHFVISRDPARRLAGEILARCDAPPPGMAGRA